MTHFMFFCFSASLIHITTRCRYDVGAWSSFGLSTVTGVWLYMDTSASVATFALCSALFQFTILQTYISASLTAPYQMLSSVYR
jgi:hypothetical protein